MIAQKPSLEQKAVVYKAMSVKEILKTPLWIFLGQIKQETQCPLKPLFFTHLSNIGLPDLLDLLSSFLFFGDSSASEKHHMKPWKDWGQKCPLQRAGQGQALALWASPFCTASKFLSSFGGRLVHFVWPFKTLFPHTARSYAGAWKKGNTGVGGEEKQRNPFPHTFTPYAQSKTLHSVKEVNETFLIARDIWLSPSEDNLD